MAKPHFADNMKQCFDDGTYSDLNIKCGDRSWKVHRMVVCSQSKVLHAACMTGFKEALTGIIDLKDDDQQAVETMLKFFYTGKCVAFSDTRNGNFSQLKTLILTYNLADKYDVPSLMNAAFDGFRSTTNRSMKESDYLSIISDIYTLPFPDNKLKAEVVRYARFKFRDTYDSDNRDLLLATLRQLPEFAFDVAVSFIDGPLKGHCHFCGFRQMVDVPLLCCVVCGEEEVLVH